MAPLPAGDPGEPGRLLGGLRASLGNGGENRSAGKGLFPAPFQSEAFRASLRSAESVRSLPAVRLRQTDRPGLMRPGLLAYPAEKRNTALCANVSPA